MLSKLLTNARRCVIIFKRAMINLIFAPVAQLVEHLTFNQGVRSSILRRSTKKADHHFGGLFFCSPCSDRLRAPRALEFETLRHGFAKRNNTLSQCALTSLPLILRIERSTLVVASFFLLLWERELRA